MYSVVTLKGRWGLVFECIAAEHKACLFEVCTHHLSHNTLYLILLKIDIFLVILLLFTMYCIFTRYAFKVHRVKSFEANCTLKAAAIFRFAGAGI